MSSRTRTRDPERQRAGILLALGQGALIRARLCRKGKVGLRKLAIMALYFIQITAGATPPQTPAPHQIGIYSGTFDPPHLGHLEVIEAARKRLGLDLIYVIPNPLTPHKPNASSYADRKHMAELQFQGPGIVVGDPALKDAIENGKDEYEILMKRHGPESRYFRIVGEDLLPRHLEIIPKTNPNLTLVVVRRATSPPGTVDPQPRVDDLGKVSIIILDENDRGHSSSEARALMEKNFNPGFVKDSVRNYIRQRNLYGSANGEFCLRHELRTLRTHRTNVDIYDPVF